MTQPWWSGLAPVEETVDCGAGTHRIRWSEGELTTPDHDDPDGERTLAALGGEPARCTAILDAWHRHDRDLDVLLLASRGPGDAVSSLDAGQPGVAPAMPARYYPGARAGMISTSLAQLRAAQTPGFASGGGRLRPAPFPGPSGHTDSLAMLLGLPGSLPDRLAATVIAGWAQWVDDDDPRVAPATTKLHAALYGRALLAARLWLGNRPEFDVVPAKAPTIVRSEDGVIRIELPFRWLGDVWARGFTVLAGRFCIAASAEPSGDWVLTTVGADLGEPRLYTLHGH